VVYQDHQKILFQKIEQKMMPISIPDPDTIVQVTQLLISYGTLPEHTPFTKTVLGIYRYNSTHWKGKLDN